jgi:hypothetical protein
MGLGGEPLGDGAGQGPLRGEADPAPLRAGEAPGPDLDIALEVHDALDELHGAAPPTRIVRRTEPSGKACSVTEWPFLRASIVALARA